MHVIWTDMLQPGVPILEKIIRTLLVYVFLLGGLRIAGKRELGQLNPFDLVVLLVLSNTVQNAIIGNDNSITGGILSAAVLLAVNYAVVRFLFLHPRLDRLAEGNSLVLIRDGQVLERRLRRELITRGELESAARRQGIDDLSQVDCARLEVGGALTFVLKHPNDEELWRREVVRWHREIAERMERIERALEGGNGSHEVRRS
jgi:uncharacterized membrane protein YcaP (DUF421 family)